MTTGMKAALATLCTAIIAFLTYALTELMPSTPTNPTPPPVSPPVVVANTVVKVIEGFERPEFAVDSDWVSSTTRTILNGAITGFVVKTAQPCQFNVTPTPLAVLKMVKTTVTVPSYTGGKTGAFYDALVPLVAANCATADYIWVDVSGAGTYQFGDATVILLTKSQLPAVPTKPMMMALPNSFLTLGHYGKYQNGSEALGIPYLQAMVAHRLHPYNSLVTVPGVVSGQLDLTGGGSLSFQKNSVDFNPTYVSLPNFSTDAAYSAAQATTTSKGWKSWFYTMDEPSSSQLSALTALLAKQKNLASSVKRLVTTTFSTSVDADIFCPVAEQFDQGTTQFPGESAYAGKDLWIYVSCMSHGCGTDLAGNLAASKISGTQTGAPDLTLDRSAAEPFGYALIARRYSSTKALLYYNTVEQYKLYPQGVDMWTGGLFNFGGNLDGTLFWPGRTGIEGLTSDVPVVSVRMKLLREAQNLSDLLSMMDPAWVATRAQAIMQSPTKWTRDVKVFEQLQKDAMAVLK